MKNRLIFILIGMCLAPPAWAQTQSPYYYTSFQPWTATATSQTSPAMALNTKNQAFNYASGTINVVGSSLTTVTFAVLGSMDHGVTYNALVIQSCGTSGATTTTVTATANGCYWVNLAGVDSLEFQTSSTFTATSVVLTLRANPNVQTAGGGGTGASGVTHTGNLTAGDCVIGNGSADIKVDPSCSTDGAGNMTATSYSATGPQGMTFTAGTAATGASGKVVYSVDATNGYGEINENNGGLSRLCTAANAATNTGCQGSAVNNYYTSTKFSGIGPTSFTPTHTLDIYDATASTGSTNATVSGGAGQSGDIFDIEATRGGTQLIRVYGGTMEVHLGFDLFGQVAAINGINTTASGTGVPAIYGVLDLTGQTATLTAQTIAAGVGGFTQQWEVGCNADTAATGAGALLSVAIGWTSPNGARTQTIISAMSLATAISTGANTTIVLNSTGNITATPTLTNSATYDLHCWAARTR